MAGGGGFGSLNQMIQTIRANKALLGRRKSILELYREEMRANPEGFSMEEYRERVEWRMKRQQIQLREQLIIRILGAVVVIGIAAFMIYVHKFSEKQEITNQLTDENSFGKKEDFVTIFVDDPQFGRVKKDFYKGGGIAAETRMKNGLKHQNSESYYPSGQQFRSALYFYDTLIVDYYFYKNGDTIKNFPKVSFDKIYNISLKQEDGTMVKFKYLDGKVILGSYFEEKVP